MATSVEKLNIRASSVTDIVNRIREKSKLDLTDFRFTVQGKLVGIHYFKGKDELHEGVEHQTEGYGKLTLTEFEKLLHSKIKVVKETAFKLYGDGDTKK